MGKLGDILTGGVAGAAANFLGGLGGAALDGLGIGPAAQQFKRQKELMEQQYKLNERAASNAYRRTKEMYDYDYDKHTYDAMRKQMEEAGLSVGLMYGGGGSAGVGGGSTGAQAAANVGLGSTEMRHDQPVDPLIITRMKDAEADIELKKAEALKQKAEAKKIEEELPYSKEKLRNEAVRIWQDNVKNRFENIIREDGITEYSLKEMNGVLNETFEIGDKSYTIIELAEEIRGKKGQATLYESMSSREQAMYDNLVAQTALLKTQNKYEEKRLQAEIDKIQKEARRLAIEMGDEYTWRSIMQDVCLCIGAVGDLTQALSVAKLLFGKDKKAIGKVVGKLKDLAEETGATLPDEPEWTTMAPGL